MLPSKIKLKNFLSHIDSSLDFNTFDLALVVGEVLDSDTTSNGAGKTSILQAIAWALYGKCGLDKADDVVNYSANVCEVEYEFILPDGNLYKIWRKRDKNSSVADVRFYIYDKNGEQWEHIIDNKGSSTAINKKIIQLVRFDYDSFINSIYFQQGQLYEFAEKRPAEKLTLLKKLLYIDRYDLYKKSAKLQKSNIEKLLAVENAKAEQLKSSIENINIFEEHIISLGSNKKEIKYSIDTITSQLQVLKKQKQDIDIKMEEIKKANVALQNYEDSVLDVQRRERDLSNLQDTMDRHRPKELKNNYLKEDAYYRQLVVDNKQFNIKELNNKRSALITRAGELHSSINSLKEAVQELLHSDNKCFICDSPITLELKNILKTDRENNILIFNQELDQIQEEQGKSSTILAEAENKKDSLQHSKEVLLSMQSEIENYTLLKRQREDKKQIVTDANNTLEALKKKYKVIESLVDSSISDRHFSISQDITRLEDDFISKNEELQSINFQEGKTSQELQAAKDSQKEYNKILKSIEKLTTDFVVSNLTIKLYNDIPILKINSALGEIETEANRILAEVSPTPMYLNIEPNTFKIGVIDKGQEISFTSLSGGEGTKVSIAVRLALSKILARRSGGQIKFLLLDEISAALDESSIEQLTSVLNNLKREFKILLISHQSRLKEYFSNIITVKKTKEGSTIV